MHTVDQLQRRPHEDSSKPFQVGLTIPSMEIEYSSHDLQGRAYPDARPRGRLLVLVHVHLDEFYCGVLCAASHTKVREC